MYIFLGCVVLFAEIHIFLKICKVQICVNYNYDDVKNNITGTQRNPCPVLQGVTILVNIQ